MSDINDRLSKLEKEIQELKKGDTKDTKEIKPKKPRQQSAYNNFMGKYITDKKKELGDLYDHKKMFAEAAKEWQKQKQTK